MDRPLPRHRNTAYRFPSVAGVRNPVFLCPVCFPAVRLRPSFLSHGSGRSRKPRFPQAAVRFGPGYSVYFVLQSCFILHTVYILCCSPVWYYIQCIFSVVVLFGLTYSVYFLLQSCLVLHTVYISCFSSVWSYIQCIFYVAVLFGTTYSVYYVFPLCLVLHTV